MTASGDAPRWAQVLATFDELVELDAPTRHERLATIGSTDPELRRSLEELLAADAEADARLAPIELAFASSGSQAADRERDFDPLGLVGRTVSHFHVVEPLAYGGMGVVYRAEDTRLGRAAALKFLLPSRHFDRSAKERFLQEARLASALDHPNVCSVYEAGETADGRMFFAMPLYAGETLRARLAREGALPVAEALGVARQIAHGLGAAHGAGIVHRDLKPANVMLLPDGAVKILDFGLAKVRDVSLTASRTRLGTASYMSPEQIQGRGVDTRTDLWALGVVLYEMLTGRRPFEGEDAVAIAHAVVHTELRLPSELRPGLPPAVDALVRALLRKDSAERPQSAERVAGALDAIAVGDPVRLPWLSPNDAARPRTRAGPRTAALTLAVLAAVAAGGWLALRGTAFAPVAPRTLAVLPFQDPSADEDSRYLALGLGDAIGTELSRLRGLVVPTYLSSSAYASTGKPLPQIAGELGADAVLTGTVQRAGAERVRVDVRLVDSKSGRRLWAQRYERAPAEVMDVQRDVLRETLAALRVVPSGAERALLDRPPATNARAYDLYLRGRELELRDFPRHISDRLPTENVRAAQSLYSRARDLDPGFALARARLAIMLMEGATRYDATPARREQARLEAEAALRLAPGLSEAHQALGSYWSWGGQDLPKAIEELELSVEGSPNSADSHIRLGFGYVALGRWEDGVAEFRRAMTLDRRNPLAPTIAAFILLRLRRDEEAMAAFDRAIALAPDDHTVKVIKGHTYLRWKGSVDTLAAVLSRVPPDWDPDGMATWARYTVLRVQRRYADALAMLDRSRAELSRDGLVYQPRALMRADAYAALGMRHRARAEYEAARAVLTDSAAAHPNDASIRVSLGLAYAGLGRKHEAVREARRAMELVPLTRSNPAATAFMGVAVEVFGRVGEVDAALELLELLLSMPAGREVTIPFLRVWPGFDPLRSDARFERLLERFAVS